MKTFTAVKKQIEKILQQTKENEQVGLQEHLDIFEHLKAWEGKSFAYKNFAAKLPGEWEVVSKVGGRHWYIKVKATGNEHMLGYSENTLVSLPEFVRLDSPYSEGAKERIAKIEKLQASEAKMNKMCLIYYNLYKSMCIFRESVRELKKHDLGAYDNPTHYKTIEILEVPYNIFSLID